MNNKEEILGRLKKMEFEEKCFKVGLCPYCGCENINVNASNYSECGYYYFTCLGCDKMKKIYK